MKKNILLLFTLTLLTLSIQAQKFGHLNSRALLMEMPEIKQADKQLETFQSSLLAKGEEMIKTFETNYNAYVVDAQSGNISALEMQSRESALQSERNAIQEYDVKIQNDIAAKREELYKPLLDRVKAVIEKIGKEQGFTMIFDTSIPGAIVHAESTQDIMDIVKAELGMQ